MLSYELGAPAQHVARTLTGSGASVPCSKETEILKIVVFCFLDCSGKQVPGSSRTCNESTEEEEEAGEQEETRKGKKKNQKQGVWRAFPLLSLLFLFLFLFLPLLLFLLLFFILLFRPRRSQNLKIPSSTGVPRP